MAKTSKSPQSNIQASGRVTRLSDLIRQPWLIGAIAVWGVAILAVLLLPRSSLPWNSLPFAGQSVGGDPAVGALFSVHLQLLEQLALIALVFYLTRKRKVPDIAHRAPALSTSRVEVLGMVGYGLGTQAIGYLLGKLLGGYPISFHLPSLSYAVGVVTAGQVFAWVADAMPSYV